MRYVAPVVLLSLWMAMSCGTEGNPSAEDAGTSQDAGTTPDAGTTSDAGTGDAGTTRDAGTGQDAGTDQDAGTTPDPGTDEDAGTTLDAGTGQDAGTAPDAGTTPDAGMVDTCGIRYLGDPAGALEFTPTAIGPNKTSSPISKGSTVSIIEPFQGGRVSFIGVRDVVNMKPCYATLIGSLRDPVSDQIVAEFRTITLRRDANGRGYTPDADDASFSNITLCPNSWSDQDIFDQDYELTLILKERKAPDGSEGKALQKQFMVRLACNVPGEEAYCRCICRKNYDPDVPCPP